MTTERNSPTPVAHAHDTDGVGSARTKSLLLILAYLGFISLGLPDAILGVAWPSVRSSYFLPQSGLGLVSMALGGGYLLSSFFGGKLTSALGTGTLLTISSFLVAIAMIGNALTPVWPLFLVCSVTWGLGSGAIDVGLNAYVASHFSPRHVNWLHAFYSLGATAGPLIMTAILVRTGSWRFGYAFVGSLIFALAVMFLLTKKRWGEPAFSAITNVPKQATIGMTLQLPVVRLQVIVFFLYTGLELTLGQWTFTVLTESRNVCTDAAGLLVGAYFGAIGIGRVVFGAVAERIGLDRLVRMSMIVAIVGSLLFTFGVSFTGSGLGLAVIGLGLAPVFPCLIAQTPRRLETGYVAHAIGFQVAAAMLGVAVAPAIAGFLADWNGLETIPRFATFLAIVLWATHELLLYYQAARGGRR